MATIKQLVGRLMKGLTPGFIERERFIDLYCGQDSFWARYYLVPGFEPRLTPQEYENRLASRREFLEVYMNFIGCDENEAKDLLRVEAEGLYRMKSRGYRLVSLDGKINDDIEFRMLS